MTRVHVLLDYAGGDGRAPLLGVYTTLEAAKAAMQCIAERRNAKNDAAHQYVAILDDASLGDAVMGVVTNGYGDISNHMSVIAAELDCAPASV